MEAHLEDASNVVLGNPGFPKHRIGDFSLFFVWGFFGVIAASVAFDEARAHNVLAAAHRSMVATVFFINATLFVLRSSAVRRNASLSSMFVAFIGTWTVVPLSLLSMTLRPDWLLALTTTGLLFAYVFVIWALLTLRRNFSVIPEARGLVRHGPYALVRHPLYAAYIFTYVLIALPRIGVAALVLASVGITCEVLRARREERVLKESFLDYEAYAASTPRFVPRFL